MFTSAAAHKHDWRTNERRSCSREPLNWIVLVFFGQNNWGKLIDLSEKGMCFQFEQPPSVKEPIEFTFEAMGCMSIPHEANVFGDSFQAAGRVVWTHEFERTAGVQFLNLSQRSRDQIVYWLSSATGQGTAAPPPEAVNVGHTAGLTEELRREWDAEWNRQQSGRQASEPFAPKVTPPALPKAPAEPFHETSEPQLEEMDSHLESFWQPEPAFRPQSLSPHTQSHTEPEDEYGQRNAEPSAFNTNLLREFEQKFEPQSPDQVAGVEQGFWKPEPEVAAQNLETPASDAEMVWAVRAHERLEQNTLETPGIPQHEQRQRRGQTLELKPQRTRVGYIAVVTCLGTLVVAAAVIAISNKSTGKAGTGEVASLAPESRVDAKSEERSVVESTGPFLVEVLDTSSRRSVLWFTGDSRQDVSTREVQRPALALSAVSTSSRDATVEDRLPAPAKGDPLRDFTLASPHPASGTSASASSTEALMAPAIGEAPLAGDAFHGTLPSPAAPVERTLPVGGDVQPARLIRAVLPAYPQLARINRVAGDVTLDALIDASGNVRDVSVISGPVFLREAAKVALKQWKYEPARLDGQPTAMHLTVTVKFKNDQK